MRFSEYKLTEKSKYRDKLFKKHMASKLWGKLGESVSTDLEAEFPGLDLDLYDTSEGYILSKIALPKEQRGFGIGTQVMQRLIDIADIEGKIIALTPDTAFGGSKGRLIDFYKRFGFVANKGRNKDFRFRNTMIRNPQSESLNELDYKGAIGAMEVMKFYQVASPAQRQELKQLMSADKLAKAWKLIQDVTGMKLSDKQFNESIKFAKPQFDVEWEEAERYPEFKKIGKEAWIELAKKGKAVEITDASDIENTDAADSTSFDQLDKAKQLRALKQIKAGNVEMPIIARYSDGYKELLGGNTRLTAMLKYYKKATVWIFDVSDEIALLAEGTDTAISLSRLGKFHPGEDTLAEFVPERATAQYALHPKKWESTFYSLTNKDSDKLRYYGPKKIAIPSGTLVGDMAIANKFYRAKTTEEKQRYAELYRQSLKPYPVDVNQYRMPELLMPRQGVAEGEDNILDKFLKSTRQTYGKRDQCGPACLDFIDWAKKQGIELKRVRGEFVADQVVSAKADFTPEMKREFAQSGLDWNSAADRKAWIEQSKYAEEWRRVPHYWTVDKNGNIHDPSGYQQFVKTGLAKDLDPSRYKKQGVAENFADGKVKGKSRPGRVNAAGASCKGSVTDLRAKAKKYSGERGKMYHWCANMKSGRK